MPVAAPHARGDRHAGSRWSSSLIVAFTFKYGPASDTILPSITASDGGSISISIPVIADVYLQRHEWRKAPVDYHIGHVIYPDPKEKTSEN